MSYILSNEIACDVERDRVDSPQRKFDCNGSGKERDDCGARKAASVGVGIEYGDEFVHSGGGDDVGGYTLFDFYGRKSWRSIIVHGGCGS